MDSWLPSALPRLPGRGPRLALYDTARQAVVSEESDGPRTMYVCGITPYDATHLGHAATMITFDLINRYWRDLGYLVRYVQNVTDIDDPLLERAQRDGDDWIVLAMRETALFREDMEALRVVPPDAYVGAVESIPSIVDKVVSLLDAGVAYPLDDGTGDVYFDLSHAPRFGTESHYPREEMLRLFGERGGDPTRAGKRDALDPLLWRGAREGEPSWDGGKLGAGRPGWHIECAAIALDHLGPTIDVQGGGNDLVFPHHECSAAHSEALTGEEPFARYFVHAGLIGLDGEKMSKSRGNLVFVSRKRGEGVDPMALRLALISGHYRQDRYWTDDLLSDAVARLARWRSAVALGAAPAAHTLLADVRAALADDLDTPRALCLVDDWAESALAGSGEARAGDPGAPGLAASAVDALLGVRL